MGGGYRGSLTRADALIICYLAVVHLLIGRVHGYDECSQTNGVFEILDGEICAYTGTSDITYTSLDVYGTLVVDTSNYIRGGTITIHNGGIVMAENCNGGSGTGSTGGGGG